MPDLLPKALECERQVELPVGAVWLQRDDLAINADGLFMPPLGA